MLVLLLQCSTNRQGGTAGGPNGEGDLTFRHQKKGLFGGSPPPLLWNSFPKDASLAPSHYSVD